MTISRLGIALGTAILVSLTRTGHGESWELARDWSAGENPGAVWSYEVPGQPQGDQKVTVVATQSGGIRIETTGAQKALRTRPLGHAADSWTNPDAAAEFPGGSQPAWQFASDKSLPFLFKSAGTSKYDIPRGRVAGHSPLVVRWTAPRDTTIDIDGGAWLPRDVGRRVQMTMGKTTADGGTVELFFYDILVPGRNSSFDSGRPFSFAHAAQFRSEARRHGTLKSVSVRKGDSIWLLLSGNGTDDYAGVDLNIRESTRAQPSTPVTIPDSKRLFSTNHPASEWVKITARGYQSPVTGVIYRRDTPAVNGLALGGIDTGCIDLETSGLWGYCTIFNSHIPRRGPMNLPFLGLSVSGETWVLCDPQQTKPGLGNFQPPFLYNMAHHVPYLEKQGLPISEPYLQTLDLTGCKTADEIHYWGHYPVADLEFDTTSPVSVGLRAWSPFLPGHVRESMVPGAVFEVHLRNATSETQKGTLAFSFPGPTALEGGGETAKRSAFAGRLHGVEVETANASYVLATDHKGGVRMGGELGAKGKAWSTIDTKLPDVASDQGGSSLAVDFVLDANESRVSRFFLTWSAPNWKGGGKPWANDDGATYTHMYDKYYPSARETAQLLEKEGEDLLRRVIAWQDLLYSDPATRGWLADSLINALYLIPETAMWAQKKPALPDWVREEDGLFGMNECPRTCPQIECVPCGFYGNLPLVYFFPELIRSTYRGYKGYTFADGAPPWVWGGWTARAPPIDMVRPSKGYQFATNPISVAAMVDRYYLCWGDREPGFVAEFYPMIKAQMQYTRKLRTTPEYSEGQRILMMPNGDVGGEWFEAGEPGWYGMATHVGGLHLAQLRIAVRLARLAGDEAFAKDCQKLLDAGMQALEDNLWEGRFYLNCFDPINDRRSEHVFGFQLDGEWIADHHGLPGVFRKDRVRTTLETIQRCNMQISKVGVVNYANPNGTAAAVGGYGPYSYFPPEVLMLAMNYMYEGRRALGIEVAQRCWKNIICTQRYTWDMPNIIRGDRDTGQRGYLNGGSDYYQDLMIWSLPAAMAGTDLGAPCKTGGLVDRVRLAAGKKK
jgi:uncharacterized protein (DUF608 family)